MITRNYFKVVRVFPDPSDYFYIKNEGYESGRIIIANVNAQTRTHLEYKIDNGSWTNFVQTWNDDGTFTLQPNSKLYLRDTAGYWKENGDDEIYFNTDEIGDISVGGDLRTLLNYTDVDSVTTIPAYCFKSTFQTGNIISIDSLTLGSSVTTLSDGCMHQMFYGSQIQKGLDLSSVTTLGSDAMGYMYADCSSLNEVYAPNVSTWDTDKTSGWLNNVASTGVIYKPANLVIPTNTDSGVPSGWTTKTYPQA